jgi:serine protease Do
MTMKRNAVFGLSLALLLAGAWLIAPKLQAEAEAPASGLQMLSEGVADTVAKAMPSVVVVRTEAIDYYLARDFYDGHIYRVPRSLAGQGSGVVIDDAGHVLTSHHVVENADRIELVFDDERKLPASMVGFDRNTDIAVLKIEGVEGVELDPIEIGDSDRLRVGEIVVAAGSPFSLSGSVTMGIVSQKGRSVGLLPFEDFIQTDASINPGNSGGPLLNVKGEMIGLNAVIQTGGPYMRGNIGIGFAIPVNLAMRVAESIIREGRFLRPWIGILPADNRDRGGAAAGILLGRVFRGTPAEKAGLAAGDLITAVNSAAVKDISELQKAVMLSGDGEDITLALVRDGERIEVRLRPEPMPETGALYRSIR